MAYRVVKVLNDGIEYIYERWRENGVHRSRYIGPVDPSTPRRERPPIDRRRRSSKKATARARKAA